MYHELTIGTQVEFVGREFNVSDIKPPKLYLYRIGDKAFVEVNLTEFLKHGKTINSPNVLEKRDKLEPDLLDILPENTHKEVVRRLNLINPILSFRKAQESDELASYLPKFPELFPKATNPFALTQEMVIDAVSWNSKVSNRTIKRYLYSYIDSDVRGLIPKGVASASERKDTRNLILRNPYKHEEILQVIDVRLEAKYVNIISREIERTYLTKKSMTKYGVIRRIEAICTKKDIEKPKSITIYKILEKIDERHLIRFRGTKKEQAKFKNVDRGYTNEVAQYPGHIVEIDHKILDIILINEDGEVVGRAWLTAGIDLYTRMIWGAHISYDEPSTDKVINLFKNGTFIKRAKEQFETNNDWSIFGKPKIFHFDNGKDFRSADVERIVTEVYGSEIDFRPIRQPQYGGAIERFFKRLDTEVIHNLDGTTKSNPADLGDINPAHYARLTLAELEKIVIKWIVDIYHFDKHQGLPRYEPIPMARYLEGLEFGGLPLYVEPSDEQQFKLGLMHQAKRLYSRDGIRLKGIQYKTSELSDLIGTKQRHIIKYDNSDISKVYLLHPEKKEYIVVPAVSPKETEIAGMHRFYYNWIKETEMNRGREWKNRLLGANNIDHAKAELDTLMYGNKNTRKGRKTLEKLKTQASDRIMPKTNEKDMKIAGLLDEIQI